MLTSIEENILKLKKYTNITKESNGTTPHLKTPLRKPITQGQPSEERGLGLLVKDKQDGARLASSGREFQSLGAATEKPLSRVPTKLTRKGGGTERKASPGDLNAWAGSERKTQSLRSLEPKQFQTL